MNDTSVRRKRRVVLMVEDDDVVRELYGRALTEQGLLVEEAITVGEALEIAPDLRPDLIILDRHLPDGDGWDVARKMKAANMLPHVPIIAFTSTHRGRTDVEAALVAGCDIFIEKTCTPQSLVRQVQALIGMPMTLSVAKLRSM